MLSVETWQVQDFLLRFDLGPPGGFKDDDHEAEDDFSAVASVGQPGQHEVEVKLGRLVILLGKKQLSSMKLNIGINVDISINSIPHTLPIFFDVYFFVVFRVASWFSWQVGLMFRFPCNDSSSDSLSGRTTVSQIVKA